MPDSAVIVSDSSFIVLLLLQPTMAPLTSNAAVSIVKQPRRAQALPGLTRGRRT